MKETKRIFKIHFDDGTHILEETTKGTHEFVTETLKSYVGITHIERITYHTVYDVRESE